MSEKPTLKQVPESGKSMWKQLFQNARGRADLKQPAGFLTLGTLLYCAATSKSLTDALVVTLGGVVMLWWVGDTTEAVAVLMALYGKWRTPETVVTSEQTNVDSQTTTVNNNAAPTPEQLAADANNPNA